MVVKLVEIKNRSYYFWNDVVFLEDFHLKLVKIDKKESQICVGIDLFFIGYIVKKPEYNIDGVNPLYLVIRSLQGYIILVIMSGLDKLMYFGKILKIK